MFIFLTQYFETSGLAVQLIREGEEVAAYIFDAASRNVCKGIVDQLEDWHDTLGNGNVYIVDGTEHGKLVEWLREQGELVVGGTPETDLMENDRREGLRIFEEYGVNYPRAKWYNDFDKAVSDIQKKPGKFVFKQQGNAGKSFSYVGKFEDGSDMIDRILYYKDVWHEKSDGPIDFLLQERIEGHEVAVGAYFNGHDWVIDENGDVAVEINFEGKKLLNGDMGATTGETTTMMVRATDENRLFQEMLLPLEPWLVKVGYKGDIDINCIVTDDGEAFALEATNRFGIPALDMQIGAQVSPWGELLTAIAEGRQPNGGLQYEKGWTCVVVVYAPPFPFETNKAENQGAGQRIYLMKDGEWNGEDEEMDEQIHPYEVELTDEGQYRLTGNSGYVLTVTGSGDTHIEAADDAINRIKNTILFSEMGYRTDVGTRLDDHIEDLVELGFLQEVERGGDDD